MLEDGRISNRQAVYLLISTILPTSAIGFSPSLIYREAAQDSWISVILLTIFGMVASWIIVSLGMRFPDRTIVQYAELVAGRFLGKVIGFLYATFFPFINIFIISFFGGLLVTYIMPETPYLVFLVGIIFAAAYAVRCGLEVFSRANEIILPVFLAFGFLLMVMLFPQMRINNFTPVLEKGMLPVIKGSYINLIYYGETIVISMFIPYLNNPRQAGRIIFKSFAVIGIFHLFTVISMTAVLGTMMSRIPVPALIGARLISIAELIERVEPLFLLLWVIGVFVKITVFYFCGALATAQLLNLKEYKALVVPTGVLQIVFSVIISGNIFEIIERMFKVTPYFLFIEAGLPLLLLIVAWLRGKGGAAGEA